MRSWRPRSARTSCPSSSMLRLRSQAALRQRWSGGCGRGMLAALRCTEELNQPAWRSPRVYADVAAGLVCSFVAGAQQNRREGAACGNVRHLLMCWLDACSTQSLCARVFWVRACICGGLRQGFERGVGHLARLRLSGLRRRVCPCRVRCSLARDCSLCCAHILSVWCTRVLRVVSESCLCQAAPLLCMQRIAWGFGE
jgi:hypothetical protein